MKRVGAVCGKLLITAACVGSGWSAHAQQPREEEREHQGSVEEIVVTAQKREQSLQDVALSVTALTEESIEKLGMEGFRDWADYVPGITMFEGIDANRRTGPSATIRGVTHTGRGQLQEGTSSLTTSYAIGQVPFFNGDPFLYDLSRVEVLRGPQGTLFGVASMGGIVRFIPNEARPDEFAAELGIGGGLITDGSETYKLEGMVNIPIVENKLAVRFSGQYRRNEGFVDAYLPALSETGQDLTVDSFADFNPRDLNVDTINGQDFINNNIIKDSNKKQTTAGRFAFTWLPTDRFSLKGFTVLQNTKQDNVDWVDFNDPRDEPTVLTFSLVPKSDSYVLSSIEASLDVGIGELAFVGGYYASDNHEAFPITEQSRNFMSGGGVDAIDADGPDGLPPDPYPARANFPFVTESTIYSAELRLQDERKSLGFNLFGDNVTLDYVFGAYFQDEEREGNWGVISPNWNAQRGPNTLPILTEGGLILGAVGGSTYSNTALFTDITLNLTERLSVGAGVRFYDQELDGEQCSHGDFAVTRAALGGTVGDDLSVCNPALFNSSHQEEDDSTARFTASYDLDEDKMLYLTAAEGKRLGQGGGDPDWPAGTTTQPECVDIAEELGVLDDIRNGTKTDTVWSYELGLKSYWMDRRLLLNTSVYQLDWTDYQQTVLFIQYSPNCNNIVAANVGEAQVRGLELEATYAPTESLTFNTAIAYTNAEFVDPPAGVSSSIAGVNLKDGDSLRGVAPWTAAVGAEYHTGEFMLMDNPARFYIRADWRYVDERMNNFGDEDLLKADPVRAWYFMEPYNLADIRAGVDTEELSLQFYAANVFDEQVMFESTRNLRQNAIRVGGSNQPRTVGFSLTRRF